MPERVQLSRAAGWRMPPNTVQVTRPGAWGNPFVVWFGADSFGVDRWHVSESSCHWPAPTKEAAQALAVEKFEASATKSTAHYGGATWLAPLRGKNLACWCKLGTPCHADVLLRLANLEPANIAGNRLAEGKSELTGLLGGPSRSEKE